MNIGNQTFSTAIILIIYWAIGYLVFNAGVLIHALIVIAAIALLSRLILTLKSGIYSIS